MAAGDTQITIAGNLVDDPELRYTPTGQAVAKFRVASTPRFRDNASGEWKDGDSLFLTCNQPRHRRVRRPIENRGSCSKCRTRSAQLLATARRPRYGRTSSRCLT